MLAAQRKRGDMVPILLQRGADANAKNQVITLKKCDGIDKGVIHNRRAIVYSVLGQVGDASTSSNG